MGHYCRNCGTALPEGARFCPKCGTTVAINQNTPPPAGPAQRSGQAPPAGPAQRSGQAPYPGPAQRPGKAPYPGPAQRSGQAQRPGQAPYPGPAQRPGQAPYPGAAQRPGQAPYRGPAQNRNTGPMPVKEKKKSRGFRPVVSFLMAVVLLVTAFVKPGFLLPFLEDLRGEGGSGSSGSGQELFGGSGRGEDSGGGNVFSVDAGDISVRYSSKEFSSAEPQTAEISWAEPTVQAGAVKVRIDYWNLESEADQLIVRELPEKSEGKQGWAVKAYDLSLASGQKEFSTDAVITIPRSADEFPMGCVWFNEAEGKWEDIYSEVSEDGRNYVIYADHFSLFGEKKYKFDKDIMRLVDNEGGDIDLSHGIFVEVPNDKYENYMNWDVAIDYTRMWNLYQKKTMEDVKNIANTLSSAAAAPEETAGSKIYGFLSDRLSEQGLVDQYNELAGNPLYDMEKLLGEAKADDLSYALTILDGALTGLKILEEAKKGNATIQEVVRDLPGAIRKSQDDLLSFAAGLAVGAALSGWIGAAAGLLLYYGSDLYKDLRDMNELADLHSDPSLEQIYNYYYTTAIRRVDFGKKSKDVKDSKSVKDSFRIAAMDVPSCMDEEAAGKLKEAVGKRGLCTKVLGESKIKLTGWDKAVTALIDLYWDAPEMFGMALDELVWNYAWSFWKLSNDDMKAYLENLVVTRPTLKVDPWMKKVREASGTERIQITDQLCNEIKEAIVPVIRASLEKKQRDSCLELQNEISKRVLPILNTRLIFHVKDTSLPSGKKFRDSVYCKNWKSIRENERFVQGGSGIRYDDPELITPMRFAGDPVPLFLPLIQRDLKDPTKPSYNHPGMNYPFDSSFLPEANSKNDIVYSCTYYHYLMMGAPTRMMFTPIDNPRYFNPGRSTYGEIMIPKLDGKEQVDIYIEVGRPDAVWELETLVYKSYEYETKPPAPDFGEDSAARAEWTRKYMYSPNRREVTIQADPDSFTSKSRAEGGIPSSSWDNVVTTQKELPGAVVTRDRLNEVLHAPVWAGLSIGRRNIKTG